MHVLYLGTCRDLYASAMAYWIRQGFICSGPASLAAKLQVFSRDLKTQCREQKLLSAELQQLFL